MKNPMIIEGDDLIKILSNSTELATTSDVGRSGPSRFETPFANPGNKSFNFSSMMGGIMDEVVRVHLVVM